MTSSAARPTKVLLVCSGLDHARRGYETFARECFDALRGEAELDLELVKGSGPPGPGERSVPTLRRDRRLALELGRLFKFRPFRLEASSFAFGLVPILLRRAPDVIYLSEWDTARALLALRATLRLRFRILFCNGGFSGLEAGRFDQVQELTPAARDHLLSLGADPARHTLLPLGFAIPPEPALVSEDARSALRRRLGLPTDRPILISVAALNREHKRIDYLIQEVAALPEPRPFLLLVGEPESETPELLRLAQDLLGPDGHSARTVPRAVIPDLLRSSDAFVLSSVAETQGRAVVEAMTEGVECLVHDSPVMRFAVGAHGVFADFTSPGALTSLLRLGLAHSDPASRVARHRFVYERFSWDCLRPRYIQLLQTVGRS